MKSFIRFGLYLMMFLPLMAQASAQLPFKLDPANPPTGIVFEIIEDSPQKLPVAMKQVQQWIKQLREHHADMEFAIVSHGSELFALETQQAEQFKLLHDNVKDLKTQDIPVHVCETFASWSGKSANDFPDYVNVSTTGPAQINDYVKLGYLKVIVDL